MTKSFKQELSDRISLVDLITTGLSKNLKEIEKKLEKSKKDYHKKAKTWALTAGPLTLATLGDVAYCYFTGEKESIVYKAIPYLQTGGILTNIIFGLKTAFSKTKYESAKNVYNLGKSIEN